MADGYIAHQRKFFTQTLEHLDRWERDYGEEASEMLAALEGYIAHFNYNRGEFGGDEFIDAVASAPKKVDGKWILNFGNAVIVYENGAWVESL